MHEISHFLIIIICPIVAGTMSKMYHLMFRVSHMQIQKNQPSVLINVQLESPLGSQTLADRDLYFGKFLAPKKGAYLLQSITLISVREDNVSSFYYGLSTRSIWLRLFHFVPSAGLQQNVTQPLEAGVCDQALMTFGDPTNNVCLLDLQCLGQNGLTSHNMDGKKLEYKGEDALNEIEKLTEKADEVQESLLNEILMQNEQTEYLRKYIKGSKLDVKEFKRCVPVTTYKDISPYIQRIAEGEDSSLISGHPITEMLCSSGTSAGEPKLMPSIAEDLDRRTFIYNLIMPIMNQYISGLDEGKAMYLYFVKAEKSLACGLPARTVLTSYYKSKHFKCRTQDSFNDFTSPDPAILCKDSNQSMYCQLLSGLIHRHQVLRMGAVFASALLRAISFLERNWVHLCNDIRRGELDPMITDPDCRSCMSIMLSSPNPCLADEIHDICSRSSWKGILCHLWPRTKYIEAVVTGPMTQYIPALEYYSGKKVPLVSTMYASSECYFGVNLNPLSHPADVVFTLMPNMCYFEFIPLGENGTWIMDVDEEEEVPINKLVDLVHVKRGCYYELVVTTFAGLYRYRIGDVLQVTGFHNKAPQFRFICRINVVLSIDNDKTNEKDLHKSVSTAKKLLEPHNALLVEYTSYADTSTVPGHYVLFWEILHDHAIPSIDHKSSLDTIIPQCCIAVEEELDYTYRRCRAYDKSVGPLEIRVVEPGTFEALMDLFIGQGGSINQYKTPRCIKSDAALMLLNSHVKDSFFSPRDPTWNP